MQRNEGSGGPGDRPGASDDTVPGVYGRGFILSVVTLGFGALAVILSVGVVGLGLLVLVAYVIVAFGGPERPLLELVFLVVVAIGLGVAFGPRFFYRFENDG